jgi:hypothetical protein
MARSLNGRGIASAPGPVAFPTEDLSIGNRMINAQGDLRMALAMAANISNRLWSIEELVERTSR